MCERSSQNGPWRFECSNFTTILGVNKPKTSHILPRETVVTDGTASIGGNIFELATLFKGVNAVEFDGDRVQMLANNVELLGLSMRVWVWHGDISKVFVAHTTNLRQDVLFLDPPWGGPEYWKQHRFCLFLNNMNLRQVCNLWANSTRLIALKLPCNFDFVDFFQNTNPAEPRLYEEIKRVVFGYKDYDQRITCSAVDNGTGFVKSVRFPKMILLVLRTTPGFQSGVGQMSDSVKRALYLPGYKELFDTHVCR